MRRAKLSTSWTWFFCKRHFFAREKKKLLWEGKREREQRELKWARCYARWIFHHLTNNICSLLPHWVCDYQQPRWWKVDGDDEKIWYHVVLWASKIEDPLRVESHWIWCKKSKGSWSEYLAPMKCEKALRRLDNVTWRPMKKAPKAIWWIHREQQHRALRFKTMLLLLLMK